MIEIREIDARHSADVNIPNEPFPLFGRVIPSYKDGIWGYELVRYAPGDVTEMCFPDEGYDYDAMAGSLFLGAYDGDRCVGLAILQPGPFRYMYLHDLKVKRAYRRRHVGSMLIESAKDAAAREGCHGLWLQVQDDNPGAFLFYLSAGFYIGGLDTNVYRHTKQEGKADILLYCETGR